MIVGIFSIQDLKAKAFVHTFLMAQIGEAERAVRTMVSEKDSQLSRYPEDFVLFKVGAFGKIGSSARYIKDTWNSTNGYGDQKPLFRRRNVEVRSAD